MKKIILLFLIAVSFSSCSDNGFNNNNPYLPNYSFSVDINMNLYPNLNYVGNAIYYSGAGIKGIYVFKSGFNYNAFDAACPNQPISSCTSKMSFKRLDPTDPLKVDQTNLVCPCDNEEYSLFTGQGKLQYPLKQYRVEVIGNTLRVYN